MSSPLTSQLTFARVEPVWVGSVLYLPYTCTVNIMAAADPRSSSDGGPASRGGFPAGENGNDRDGPGGSSSGGASGEGERERDRATFECNICLDTARDAVISMCGHLFWYETTRGRGVVLLLLLLLFMFPFSPLGWSVVLPSVRPSFTCFTPKSRTTPRVYPSFVSAFCRR